MITYPGLPGPAIAPHLTREASRDPTPRAPSSRSTSSPWSATPGLTSTRRTTATPTAPTSARSRSTGPPTCPPRRASGRIRPARAIDVGAVAGLDVRGQAVLLHTGDDAGSARPATPRARISSPGPAPPGWPTSGAALVGIDAINIDDTDDGKPAHTLLLAAGHSRRRASHRPRAAAADRRPVHGRAAAHRGASAPSRCALSPGCRGRPHTAAWRRFRQEQEVRRTPRPRRKRRSGSRIRLTHTSTRQKFANLSREPRVALSIADPDDQYRFLEIRGTVETIEVDPGAEFYRSLQQRYGMDYPILDAEVRVIITVRPDRYVAVRGGSVVSAEV